MASISFPKKEIEKEIKLTAENMHKISMMGIPIEVNGLDVNIEVLPNRPDLLSQQGFLRAVKIFMKEPGLKKYRINRPEKDYKVIIDESVKKIRPYTACAIVKGMKFDDAKIKEIIDMQEKLHATLGRNRKKVAIGIYPMEKITLPIRFEARAPDKIKFMPLESSEEMSGLQILQRHPAGREYAHLLQEKDKFPIFIDAKNNILSMPPIINSHETGKITESTRDVFIECSGFDFPVLSKTLNIIVTTLSDLGGKIYAMDLEYDKKITTPNMEPEAMKINLESVNRLLGLNLKEKDLEKLLPKMGYDYCKGKVQIPAWRTDILHEVDIAEDIAIAYGYENLVPEIPKVATIAEESKESRAKSRIAEILAGLGLIEISSLHLIKAEEIKCPDLIEILDSKTEYKILRPNLLIPALRTLSQNKDNEYPQKIFELGSVFAKDSRQETGIKESLHLLIAVSPGHFTETKQILDYLARMLNIDYSLKETVKDSLIDGRTASILINNKDIGLIGEVHPEALRQWNLALPAAVIEIDLDKVL